MHFITFSRLLGTNGEEIAKKVAARLGYRLVDTEDIDNKAREMGFLESVAEMDEKAPSFLKRVFSNRPNINLARLNSIIDELGKEGNAVFIGRGGHILLKNFGCALHVRVVASRKTRIRNLVERGYEEKNAEHAIEQSDQDRGGFMQFAFGVDWNDSKLYDLVLNVDKVGLDSAEETVVSLAESGDIKSCSLQSLEVLGNQALASRAEAAIMEAGLSYGINTTVFVSVEEPGNVKLSGFVYNDEAKASAEETVKGVKGVEGVENEIRVLPPEGYT
jgi:cytidylate kinase